MNSGSSRSPYVLFQRALIALLALDCMVYALYGSAREVLDAFAWFALLILFYLETSVSASTRREVLAAGLRYARLAAGIAVVAAACAYVDAADWLDAMNSAAWIGVVILLEAQVRYPALASRHRRAFIAAAVLLYGALAALPLAWVRSGNWLDAYDAALWLAAFVTIELDVRPAFMQRRRRSGTPR